MIPVELRTQPLVDVNAYFVYPGQKVKHFVLPAWKIAHCTFDQLGPAWTEGIEWFAATPKTPPRRNPYSFTADDLTHVQRHLPKDSCAEQWRTEGYDFGLGLTVTRSIENGARRAAVLFTFDTGTAEEDAKRRALCDSFASREAFLGHVAADARKRLSASLDVGTTVA